MVRSKRHCASFCDNEVQWGGEYPIFKEDPHENFYVTASDLLRLRVLYQWGGFYADFDVLPRRLQAVLCRWELPLLS